jgi:hypothetical protein
MIKEEEREDEERFNTMYRLKESNRKIGEKDKISEFIRHRMRECKLNRNKAYEVGNEQLGDEWIHVYNELGQVLKEIGEEE